MYTGSMVAIVTPFKDGKVDEASLKKLIDFQIENGTKVLVPCGTTGESATLSVAEHHRVIDLVVQLTAGRVPVIAGTGSNNTAEAIELTKAARAAGATASLQITPYYNKPTQEGVYQHFIKLAESADFPMVLYNIQGRTGINVLPETIARIAKDCPLLVAVKEASGNLEQISRLHSLLDEKVAIISGDDALTLPIIAVGGKGVISVIANIAPRQTADFVADCLAGKFSEALTRHETMLPMVKALFLESNPTPVKAAMELMGLCSAEVRLPLVGVAEETREKIRIALQQFGLLS
ncbi:4-hydroxy-tetrahydrodipicolinate synthase [bacterium]|nr:4-hydroxy-tetrahydrodipicolinate synthase [bacterium]